MVKYDTVRVYKTIAFLLASMVIAILIRDYKAAVRSIEFNQIQAQRADQRLVIIKADRARIQAEAAAKAEQERIQRESQQKLASESVETPAAPSRRITTYGVEQWRPLVAAYFPGEVEYALAIMQCESGGNPNALSPTQDRGLMQVNQVHAGKVDGDLERLYDPETNLRVAKQIRDGSGWGAWSCSRKI